MAQPSRLIDRPFTRLPMIAWLLAISMMRTRRGGARKPLITAVQKSAVTGLMPRKLMSKPTRVDAVMMT